MMTPRTLALLLLLAAGCLSPKPGTDLQPAAPFRGSFVSAAVSGQKGGIGLRGQLLWHGAVRGSRGGVSLDGLLR